MKNQKIFLLVAMALVVSFVLVSCLSLGIGGGKSSSSAAPAERKVSKNVPDFIVDAMKNVPNDTLVGIGNAKLGTAALSRTTATTRARAEISRQISSIILDMVQDYTASSEVDPKAAISFTENITSALSKSTLSGSKVVDVDYTEDGTCWAIVSMPKANIVREIKQAQVAAKQTVPEMATFEVEEQIDDSFEQVNLEVQIIPPYDNPAPGKRYEVVDHGLTWEDAAAAAKSRGGYLAVITSAAEQKLVQDLMVSTGTKRAYWLGASSVGNRQFVWVTGEPWGYANWVPGQPDGNMGGSNEKLTMRLVTFNESFPNMVGQWDDADSMLVTVNPDDTLGYIIEWD